MRIFSVKFFNHYVYYVFFFNVFASSALLQCAHAHYSEGASALSFSYFLYKNKINK